MQVQIEKLQVDQSHAAARISVRPTEHIQIGGSIGGHYVMAFGYSNTAAKPAAASDVVSLRWADSRMLFQLMYLKVWVVCTTTYTATMCQDLALYKVINFSVAASGGTQITPSGGSAQRMRMNNMNPTLIGTGVLGAGGLLWVSSGDLLTTGTRVLDTQPCGYVAWQNPITTPNSPIFLELFETRDVKQHPITLAANEGLVIQTPIGNAQVAGVSKFTFIMGYAELPAF
jgi:hypothetical protein